MLLCRTKDIRHCCTVVKSVIKNFARDPWLGRSRAADLMVMPSLLVAIKSNASSHRAVHVCDGPKTATLANRSTATAALVSHGALSSRNAPKIATSRLPPQSLACTKLLNGAGVMAATGFRVVPRGALRNSGHHSG